MMMIIRFPFYCYGLLTEFFVHIVGVLGNDEDLRDYFLSLLSVIESTQHYLSTRSLDLLEYCQRSFRRSSLHYSCANASFGRTL